MRKFFVTLAAAAVLTAGVGLAGCSQGSDEATTTPVEHIKQGARQIGQGVTSMGAKVADYATDAAITAHVKTRLAANQGLSSFNISVETEDGVVTLTGTVERLSQRRLAATVAADTEGVKAVNNRIRVDKPAKM